MKVFSGFAATVILMASVSFNGNAEALPRSKPYLKAMEDRMTEEEKDMLKRVFSPTAVLVPPSDVRSGLCVLPDGEIRCYGYDNDPYYSSIDGGLTWKKRYCKGRMRSSAYFPDLGIWVKAFSERDGRDKGTNVYISTIGPDDDDPVKIKVSDEIYFDLFLPQKTERGGRVYFTGQRENEREELVPAFIYSDDNCKTWRVKELPVPPRFEITPPHKGDRWSLGCGSEPSACEISEGKMMMVIRNSTNNFYESFSYDNGTSWSEPEPSVFHGTLTTPAMLPLADGRVLFFWNNSRPLVELNHSEQTPPLPDFISEGKGEDVFTNRDVCHAAVSDDGGETWTGAREMFLNEIRNRPDYRYIGGNSSFDKSVQQFQAIELPFGKILCAFGQNSASRRAVVFDVNWLREKSRREDFKLGLDNVSTQVYLKSVSGSTVQAVGNGHCSWNRTNGAVMSPDPDGGYAEAVQISRISDQRLFNETQGLVWNFPASLEGEVEAELYLAQDKVRISLSDTWFNPCDECIGLFAQYSVTLDENDITPGAYHKISISFDCPSRSAQVYADGTKLCSLTALYPVQIGISYVHIQCVADKPSRGVFLKSLSAQGER